MDEYLQTNHVLFLAEVNKAQGIKVLKDGKVVPVEKAEQPQGAVTVRNFCTSENFMS